MRTRPLGWQNYKSTKIKLRRRYFLTKLIKEKDVEYKEEEERPKWDHDVATDLKATTESLNKYFFF